MSSFSGAAPFTLFCFFMVALQRSVMDGSSLPEPMFTLYLGFPFSRYTRYSPVILGRLSSCGYPRDERPEPSLRELAGKCCSVAKRSFLKRNPVASNVIFPTLTSNIPATPDTFWLWVGILGTSLFPDWLIVALRNNPI